MLAISPACLIPFLSGRPDTTRNESLLVSTSTRKGRKRRKVLNQILKIVTSRVTGTQTQVDRPMDKQTDVWTNKQTNKQTETLCLYNLG